MRAVSDLFISCKHSPRDGGGCYEGWLEMDEVRGRNGE